MLSIDPKADPMDSKSWRQHPDPVFTRDDDAKVYGPGHNSFFRSPDGKEDWIAYHAKTGTARTYADRLARAKIHLEPEGTPHFGKPLPLDADIREPSGETAAGKSHDLLDNQPLAPFKSRNRARLRSMRPLLDVIGSNPARSDQIGAMILRGTPALAAISTRCF